MDIEIVNAHLAKVRAIMMDGKPHTLVELGAALGCGNITTGVSARVRDLRKPEFGGHTIVSKRVDGGVWQYTMIIDSSAPMVVRAREQRVQPKPQPLIATPRVTSMARINLD